MRRSADTPWADTGVRWLALLIGLSVGGPCAAVVMSISDTEVAVFETLINHGLDDDQRILVIAAETTGDPAAIGEHGDTAAAMAVDLGVPAETLASWIRMNAAVAAIDQPLRLDVSYQLLDDTEREKLFAADEPQLAWSQFFARYEGAPGLLRLSRAGFDHDRRHALVYVEYQCGMECGAGRLVHLARGDDDNWQVKGAVLVWMVE